MSRVTDARAAVVRWIPTPRRWLYLTWASINAYLEDRTIRIGAGLAYYFLITLAPLLFIAVSIAGLFVGDAAAEGRLVERLDETFGADLARLIETLIGQVHIEESATILTLVGIGVLLFSASVLFVAWQDAINLIMHVPRRHGIRATLRRRIFALAVIFAAGLMLVLVIFLETIVSAVEQITPGEITDALLRLAGAAGSAVVGAVFLALMYQYATDIKLPWRDVIAGTVYAVVLLALGAWLYGLYLGSFAAPSAAGIAGAVILLLVLVYYAAQILLFGAQFIRVRGYVRGHPDKLDELVASRRGPPVRD